MSSLQQSKRPRTSDFFSTSKNAPPDLQISETFWHNDGDLAICVKTILYRVHQSLLAIHSRLFRPDSIHRLSVWKTPTVLNMQIFVLPCDSVEDFERVLTFVYNPAKLNLWGKTMCIHDIFSLIRVAGTLEFESIITLCMQRFETALPTTLSAFDAAYTIPKSGGMLKPGVHIDSTGDLFKIINLTIGSDHKRFIPCAYLLALMEASVTDITHGVTSTDGSRIQLHPQAQQTLLIAHANIYPALLNRFSDAICTNLSSMSKAFCASTPASKDCWGASTAAQSRFRAHVALDVMARRLIIASHRKGEWFEDAFGGERCAPCVQREKARMDEERQKFWVGLPEFFGLAKTWNELGSSH